LNDLQNVAELEKSKCLYFLPFLEKSYHSLKIPYLRRRRRPSSGLGRPGLAVQRHFGPTEPRGHRREPLQQPPGQLLPSPHRQVR